MTLTVTLPERWTGQNLLAVRERKREVLDEGADVLQNFPPLSSRRCSLSFLKVVWRTRGKGEVSETSRRRSKMLMGKPGSRCVRISGISQPGSWGWGALWNRLMELIQVGKKGLCHLV